MRNHSSSIVLLGIFLAAWAWITYALGYFTLSLPIAFIPALGATFLFFKFGPEIKLLPIPKKVFLLLAVVLLQMITP